MVNSCFFCQNLLSDFRENLLTSLRRNEIKDHVETCSDCQSVSQNLEKMEELLTSLPVRPVSHELALRIVEASEGSGRSTFVAQSRTVWTTVGSLGLLLLLTGTLIWAKPNWFHWMPGIESVPIESRFVRYYPLFHGAVAILEEQSSWIQLRDSFMASLWEEGGLSPEEFERAFGAQSLVSDK